MSAHRTSSARLATQVTELALAAPQVVAHRLTRMAQAGHTPSAADRREFEAMGAEKLAAFQESWLAIGAEAWQQQQRAALSVMRSFMTPWTTSPTAWLPTSAQATQNSVALWGAAMRPVHRRAVANAKRLGRTRRR